MSVLSIVRLTILILILMILMFAFRLFSCYAVGYLFAYVASCIIYYAIGYKVSDIQFVILLLLGGILNYIMEVLCHER